jgi:hypothetical protein
MVEPGPVACMLVHERGCGNDHTCRRVGPAAHALSPGARVPPGAGWHALDPLEQPKLGSVQVRDDRNARERAQRRLVDRRQVVEVQDVRAGGTSAR